MRTTFTIFIRLFFVLLGRYRRHVTMVHADFRQASEIRLGDCILKGARHTPPTNDRRGRFNISVQALRARGFTTRLVRLAVAPFLQALIARREPSVPRALFLVMRGAVLSTNTCATHHPFETRDRTITVTVLGNMRLFFGRINSFAGHAFR